MPEMVCRHCRRRVELAAQCDSSTPPRPRGHARPDGLACRTSEFAPAIHASVEPRIQLGPLRLHLQPHGMRQVLFLFLTLTYGMVWSLWRHPYNFINHFD